MADPLRRLGYSVALLLFVADQLLKAVIMGPIG